MHELHDLLIKHSALLHISCTGAGLSALREVWSTPGSSKYLAGAAVPYDATQLALFLGYNVEGSCCSQEVAVDMAVASYIRASESKVCGNYPLKQPLGIGISASVASTRLPRGEQRVHIAVLSRDRLMHSTVQFKKGQGRDKRLAQDDLIGRALLLVLDNALSGNQPQLGSLLAEATTRFLLRPTFRIDGTRGSESLIGMLMPASLNPIHDGHRTMAGGAEYLYNQATSYLIASDPVHKSKLTLQQMAFKSGMLRAERWNDEARAFEFTRGDPLFIDKARARPSSTFVVGVDTAERLLDPKWGHDPVDLVREFAELHIHFLVMGRVWNGGWKTINDIRLPPGGHEIFKHLHGRTDVSSAQIREVSNA